MTSSTKRDLLILTLFSAFLFLLGNWDIAITDPVESNYTLTATEMLESGDYISPRIYGNYWYDKPAFFYWELIAAYKLFGISEFASRFFPSLFGVIGVLMTYGFARKLYDAKTGFFAAAILGTAFEYWLLSKTVITDLTLFVFFNAVLIFFYLAYSGKNKNLYYLCYFFSGLAVLDKGPIGLLLPGFIMTVFICVRRDFKEVLNMKPLAGAVIFVLTAGGWYYQMYQLHGDDFINTFLGVHNFLRATVSEHPRWDVWYYYLGIFFIGFFPWSFTLPAVITKYIKRREKPVLDTTTLFLLLWALLINIFYQCMATKYTTYTLPGLLPIAILAARYLYNHEKLVKRLLAFNVVLYVALTFLVAIPACSNAGYSGKNVAAVYKDRATDNDLVVSYGDYKTSLVFYGRKMVYRLETAEVIAESRPDGKSWNAKNVMPYISFEELPRDKDVYLVLNSRKFNDFEKVFKAEEWELLDSFKEARVYLRKAK